MDFFAAIGVDQARAWFSPVRIYRRFSGEITAN